MPNVERWVRGPPVALHVLEDLAVHVRIQLCRREPPALSVSDVALGDETDPHGLLDYRQGGVVLGLAQIEADVVAKRIGHALLPSCRQTAALPHRRSLPTHLRRRTPDLLSPRKSTHTPGGKRAREVPCTPPRGKKRGSSGTNTQVPRSAPSRGPGSTPRRRSRACRRGWRASSVSPR